MDIIEIKHEFEQLPTVPPTDETLFFIDKVLYDPEISKKDRYEFADIFFDLIAKLTDNYAHLRADQITKTIDWIEINWDEKDVEYTDLLVSIVVNTETVLAKDFLSNKIALSENASARRMFREALEEISK